MSTLSQFQRVIGADSVGSVLDLAPGLNPTAGKYIKADGAVYARSTYPELAALFPTAPSFVPDAVNLAGLDRGVSALPNNAGVRSPVLLGTRIYWPATDGLFSTDSSGVLQIHPFPLSGTAAGPGSDITAGLAAFNSTLFAIIGTSIFASTDAATWTGVSQNLWYAPRAVFAATTRLCVIATAISNNTQTLFTSVDGTTWVQQTVNLPSLGAWSCMTEGDVLYAHSTSGSFTISATSNWGTSFTTIYTTATLTGSPNQYGKSNGFCWFYLPTSVVVTTGGGTGAKRASLSLTASGALTVWATSTHYQFGYVDNTQVAMRREQIALAFTDGTAATALTSLTIGTATTTQGFASGVGIGLLGIFDISGTPRVYFTTGFNYYQRIDGAGLFLAPLNASTTGHPLPYNIENYKNFSVSLPSGHQAIANEQGTLGSVLLQLPDGSLKGFLYSRDSIGGVLCGITLINNRLSVYCGAEAGVGPRVFSGLISGAPQLVYNTVLSSYTATSGIYIRNVSANAAVLQQTSPPVVATSINGLNFVTLPIVTGTTLYSLNLAIGANGEVAAACGVAETGVGFVYISLNGGLDWLTTANVPMASTNALFITGGQIQIGTTRYGSVSPRGAATAFANIFTNNNAAFANAITIIAEVSSGNLLGLTLASANFYVVGTTAGTATLAATISTTATGIGPLTLGLLASNRLPFSIGYRPMTSPPFIQGAFIPKNPTVTLATQFVAPVIAAARSGLQAFIRART